MKKEKRNELVYTREDMVGIISEQTSLSMSVVRAVIDELEMQIYDILSSSSESTDNVIKLFRGITFYSRFIPQKNQVNNITGEMILTKEKIKPKVKFARYYCEELHDIEEDEKNIDIDEDRDDYF